MSTSPRHLQPPFFHIMHNILILLVTLPTNKVRQYLKGREKIKIGKKKQRWGKNKLDGGNKEWPTTPITSNLIKDTAGGPL